MVSSDDFNFTYFFQLKFLKYEYVASKDKPLLSVCSE